MIVMLVLSGLASRAWAADAAVIECDTTSPNEGSLDCDDDDSDKECAATYSIPCGCTVKMKALINSSITVKPESEENCLINLTPIDAYTPIIRTVSNPTAKQLINVKDASIECMAGEAALIDVANADFSLELDGISATGCARTGSDAVGGSVISASISTNVSIVSSAFEGSYTFSESSNVGGIIHLKGGVLTMENSVFVNGFVDFESGASSESSAGSIYASGMTEVVIKGTTFITSSGTYEYPAVYVSAADGGSIDLMNNLFLVGGLTTSLETPMLKLGSTSATVSGNSFIVLDSNKRSEQGAISVPSEADTSDTADSGSAASLNFAGNVYIGVTAPDGDGTYVYSSTDDAGLQARSDVKLCYLDALELDVCINDKPVWPSVCSSTVGRNWTVEAPCEVTVNAGFLYGSPDSGWVIGNNWPPAVDGDSDACPDALEDGGQLWDDWYHLDLEDSDSAACTEEQSCSSPGDGWQEARCPVDTGGTDSGPPDSGESGTPDTSTDANCAYAANSGGVLNIGDPCDGTCSGCRSCSDRDSGSSSAALFAPTLLLALASRRRRRP